MRTLEDLVDSMERYAERGDPRGADAVLASATASSRSHSNHRELTRWGAPVAVAAVLLIVVSIVLVARSREVTVSTDTSLPPPTTTEGAAIVPSIAVPDGQVQLVRAGFGRMWVVSTDFGAIPPSTKVRSFDPGDGKLLSESPVVGAVAHNGFGHTETALWLRTSTGGPASFPIGTGGEGDNAIYRVDPTSGDAEPVAYLNGDGPIATSNQRVAAADVDHVMVLDQSGDQIGESTIDDATGVENATFPGTNGILGLTYSTSSPLRLFARHQGRNELLELNQDTGAHVATQSLDSDPAAGVSIAASSDAVWLGRPGTVLGIAVPFGARPPETRATPSVDGFPQLEIIADHHLAAWTPSAIALLDLAGTSIDTTQMRPGETGDLLLIDGRLWIASWPSGDPGGPTTVTFEPGPALSAAQSETVVVPSVVGMPLRDALPVLDQLGLAPAIDPDLNSIDADATIITQYPGPGAIVGQGTRLGLRTAGPVPAEEAQCPSTRHPQIGSASAPVPNEGDTDLDYVRAHDQSPAITALFPAATRMYLVHRNGDVRAADGTTHAAADYQLVLEVSEIASCPAGRQLFDGIPLIFIPQPAAPTPTSAPPPASDSSVATRLLEIDEIGIRAPIVDGETTDALTDAVAHLPGTAAIGTPGVAVIVGHRTTYTAPFLRLDALRPGDHIIVIEGDHHMQFTVTNSRTVEAGGPSESTAFGVPSSELDGPEDGAAYVRLITFAPNYSDAQRLIIDAVLDGI